MTTWIVTPTYNERDNLKPLIDEIFSIGDVDVVVVDDNSPDGTGQLADELHQQHPRIHVIHRPAKAGLGTAYQAGFRYALEHGAQAIIQLDADRSHPPSLIPALLAALDNHDVVIASRYVPGGRVNIVWFRRWISTFGNVYIRLLLGWDIHDWSTGYKAWRADILNRILAQTMEGRGYAWLMEMTWLARRAGARVAEVPMVFTDRRAGQSKFSWSIIIEDLRLAWRLSRR